MRADLLALTRPSLEDLANRGLVKRATREVEGGKGPTITESDDGTVTGEADGVITVLAPGVGLADTECNCSATGICRHRLAVVLAYQALHVQTNEPHHASTDAASAEAGSTDAASAEAGDPPAGTEATVESWSPGQFTDEDLVEQFGRAALTAARRMARSGHLATVHRPTRADATPAVELENTTVRFLVPNDLNYVSASTRGTDAAPFVVLAVWAFRKADEIARDKDEVLVDVSQHDNAAPDMISLQGALLFADRVLLDGATTITNAELLTEPARRALDRDRLRWPLAVLEDLIDQIEEYANRGALYSPATTANLVAELHARQRAAAADSELPAARILGTTEAAEAGMRHLRLDGLGCRISGQPDDRRVDIFFAHADAATAYVIRRRDLYQPGTEPTADAYANRIGAAQTSIRALSQGNIITSAANRKANREIRIGRSTVAKTSVVPSGAAWEKMAAPLRVTDLAELTATMATRPPSMIRARVLAESLHAIQIKEVLDVRYRPGSQLLQAMVSDPSGNRAFIELAYRSVAPGALDALHAVLTSDELRFISGFVSGQGDAIQIDPVGAGTDRLIAFDTAPEQGIELPSGRIERAATPHGDAIEAALDHLADGVHRGLRNVAPSFGDCSRKTAHQLNRTGLVTSAAAITTFANRLDQFRAGGDPIEVTTAWVDARLRLLLASEATGQN